MQVPAAWTVPSGHRSSASAPRSVRLSATHAFGTVVSRDSRISRFVSVLRLILEAVRPVLEVLAVQRDRGVRRPPSVTKTAIVDITFA